MILDPKALGGPEPLAQFKTRLRARIADAVAARLRNEQVGGLHLAQRRRRPRLFRRVRVEETGT